MSGTKRFFHSSLDDSNDIINVLYKNKIDPSLKVSAALFDSDKVDTCYI